jgi:hypothetical protein
MQLAGISMVAAAVSSFPNSIWERSLFHAKFHFALTQTGRHGIKIGNEIASASAFPNGVWERGKVAAVGSTADRHPADGGYQLHTANGGELYPKKLT